MSVYPVPRSSCPYCGLVVEQVACFGRDAPPEVGDPRLCPACARVSTFGPDMKLIRPAPADLSRILRGESGPAICRAQRAILDRPAGSSPPRGA